MVCVIEICRVNDCLVVLRAAAGRLAPDAQTKVTLHKKEAAVRDLAIRAEVHPDPEIRKTADYFQQRPPNCALSVGPLKNYGRG
jgi:hypothetical protein